MTVASSPHSFSVPLPVVKANFGLPALPFFIQVFIFHIYVSYRFALFHFAIHWFTLFHKAGGSQFLHQAHPTRKLEVGLPLGVVRCDHSGLIAFYFLALNQEFWLHSDFSKLLDYSVLMTKNALKSEIAKQLVFLGCQKWCYSYFFQYGFPLKPAQFCSLLHFLPHVTICTAF